MQSNMASRGIWSLLILLCCIFVSRAVMTTTGQCTKYCMNGGYCVWSGNTTYCACPDQYFGDSCELTCNTTQCAGGRCIIHQSSSMCLCPGGYIDSMCSTNCTDTFCQNNGTCSTNVDGMSICTCTEGYSGSRCEINKTEIINCSGTPCNNIVTQNCTQKSGGSIMCHCRTDYTGTYCNRRNCLNTQLFNCSPNGVCNLNDVNVDPSVCSCKAGYNGTDCNTNIDDCVGVTCENGGTCVDGIASFNCSCPALYTGTYCEEANCVARGCANLSGNGVCDTSCIYEECGYDGLDCSVGVNPWDSCTVVPTSRGRHCSVLFMDGVCDQDCNTLGCLYDGFDCVNNGTMLSDCFNSSYCLGSLGNSVCDARCNNLECAYDGHACADTTTTNSETLIATFSPTNASFGILAEARYVAYLISRKLRTRVFIRQTNGTDNLVYRVANSSDSNIRAYYDIQKPSDCSMASSCVTDVQTAAKMIGAVVWMYSLNRTADKPATDFRSITTCKEGFRYINGTCNNTCNVGCQSVCNFESGSCVDCIDGYVGNTCDVHCSPNCAGTCNATQCIGGCNAGYTGNNCDQACSTGKYGADCNMTCSECANDDCNNVNGICAQGCKNAGLTGRYCTDNCASGDYGINCNMSCSSNCLNKKCDRVTGYCLGVCPTDKWGNTCDQDCTRTTCTTKCEACTTTTTTTTGSPSNSSENTNKGVIAAVIILVILIIAAVIIAYLLWRRSQAGVYDLDEKKGDELPLNAANMESGNSNENPDTPMVPMGTGNGQHEVQVVSETSMEASDKTDESKPLMSDETKPVSESERKEPEGRENSAERDDPEESLRESREMKTASKYLPPTEKEGGPGGVYVGPAGPKLTDVEAEQETGDLQQDSEDASFPVAPAELVSPPPVQQDADPPAPPSPPPEADTPPTPPSSPPPEDSTS
ncbi:neurogenic locus notch homolog protein 1-like [Ylistrum balloti]|uniref:neurogenic locus notch homolog protein 1-like n=1 Tax=Ylistrum balloti TaxID=509963 RepID=UPI0029058194|nr:neurogenic locus notch homolog protein 1-like [Ylistrum balloti]